MELLSKADTVCLTGGEPFLIKNLGEFAENIRNQYPGIKNIYAYTSGGEVLYNYLRSNNGNFGGLTGITIAPKSLKDWTWTQFTFDNFSFLGLKSPRLIVFKEQQENFNEIMKNIPGNFNILGRTWDTKFNTPRNEIFCRLPVLWEK